MSLVSPSLWSRKDTTRDSSVLNPKIWYMYMYMYIQCTFRESVDSLCRDGADTPMPPYIGKAFTRTNFEDISLFRYINMVCE